ncbi:hypothetical protein TNCV_3659551 [Trichonephila clavipes]|nr:hypothetical protein TNCV_3659551 [Trichonephila clavipes]
MVSNCVPINPGHREGGCQITRSGFDQGRRKSKLGKGSDYPGQKRKKERKIVRVQYFVRGGSVGHRSRASSKHLSPHLPVDEQDSSGVKQELRCTCRCTCGCRGHKESRLDVDVFEK